MSTIDFRFEELELAGGVALCSGEASIAFDRYGDWWIDALRYPHTVKGKPAIYGYCPNDVIGPDRPIRFRLIKAAESDRTEMRDLSRDSPLYAVIHEAFTSAYADNVIERILAQDDDAAAYSRSMSDRAQHGLGIHNML